MAVYLREEERGKTNTKTPAATTTTLPSATPTSGANAQATPTTPTTKKTTTTSANTLRKGSTGAGVRGLQTALNKFGYNLVDDGIFGEKTLAAVMDFQKQNGLDVDGIVGTQTWGALANGKTGASTPSQTEAVAPTFDYTQSDGVKQNWADYWDLAAQKPGEADKTWFNTLIDTWNQINNRENFSYDLNGDMLYQQYKDQYNTQGELAMMDAIGQAAAMTGGYGSSYAQTAGQQAYQGYLQQLNDKVPELYQLALDKYNQEGQDLYNKAGLLFQMDESAYNRNQNEWDNYYKQLGTQFEMAKYMDDTEYGRYLDKYGIENDSFWNNKNFDEGVRQWQADHDLNGDMFEWEKEQAGKASGGGDTEFHKATYSHTDSNGNLIWYINGKEVVREPGANPYTGTVNPDVKNGYWPSSRGYQPDNLGTYEVNGKEVVNKLSKTGMTDVVNGVTQNVWRDQKDGKLWIWDGTQNEYLQYQE